MSPQIQPTALHCRVPSSIEETGISQGLILDIVLRQAFFEGIAAIEKLMEGSRLRPAIIHYK